jgi:hypothetical protein
MGEGTGILRDIIEIYFTIFPTGFFMQILDVIADLITAGFDLVGLDIKVVGF